MTQLYLISPPQIDDLGAFEKTLQQLLASPHREVIGAFQLRLKEAQVEPAPGKLTLPSSNADNIKRTMDVLLPLCHAYALPILLNDSPELARECGADGVHVGQEDGTIEAARKILGSEAVIGATCHDSRHLAMEAGEQGADYVAFGAFFPTTSKTEAAQKAWGVPKPEIIGWWVEHTTVPCVAIGGITPENCVPLVQAQADFLAVITSLWHHKEGPLAALEKFAKVIEAYAPVQELEE